jgi:hypothetical protein
MTSQFIGKNSETLKTLTVKSLETRFAPLYYKRITFKLNKDAKTFNFPIYFVLINLLYAKKLYQPCITLLLLIITEISGMSYDLYKDAKTNKSTECFLYLYEFLLFKLVYLLIKIKNFDRALYELLQIDEPINELNRYLYKLLLGLCQSHCLYYDLAVLSLSEAYYIIKPFIESYKLDDDSLTEEKAKRYENCLEAPEAYLTEMRMFSHFTQTLITGTMSLYTKFKSNKLRVCFRCRAMNNNINTFCLNCQFAVYCSKKCMKKNYNLHKKLCDYFVENNSILKSLMETMSVNYLIIEEKQNKKLNKIKENL